MDSNGLDTKMLCTPLPNVEQILSETAANTEMSSFCQFVLFQKGAEDFKALLAAIIMFKMDPSCLPNIIFPSELRWVLGHL